MVSDEMVGTQAPRASRVIDSSVGSSHFCHLPGVGAALRAH